MSSARVVRIILRVVNADSPRTDLPKRLSDGHRTQPAVELKRRSGFLTPPRMIVPALVVVVAALALASLDGGSVSSVRILSAVAIGIGMVILFGLLVVLSRARAGSGSKGPREREGAST